MRLMSGFSAEVTDQAAAKQFKDGGAHECLPDLYDRTVFLLVLLFVQDKRPCETTKLFYPSYGFNHVVANGGKAAHDSSYSVVDFKINYN